jgi:hypothetical protein
MKFNVSGEIKDSKIPDREAAYLELIRISSGGSPCLESRPGLIQRLENRGEATFDFEFIGYRPFVIEGIKY